MKIHILTKKLHKIPQTPMKNLTFQAWQVGCGAAWQRHGHLVHRTTACGPRGAEE